MQFSGTPVAFVHVADRARALTFYCETLGLKLHSSDSFGDVLDLGGALLRITTMDNYKPHAHPVLGWDVADIIASVQALGDRGVRFSIFEGFGQDALGIWTSPDGKSRVAFFSDPHGNVLTLSQT